MGAVFDEFEQQLRHWHRKYAAQPRRELICLFLLALEREELVSIGYRESVILSRLAAMPVPQEVRELIHHALLWAWKDEEMHSIYIRGAILRLGGASLRLRAFIHQMAGATGGWAGSVLQHVRMREAPLSRCLATVLTSVGGIAGKVPRDVREYLDYCPFRDFCAFNVDAEKTAWLCWQRIIELARNQSDLPTALISDFERIVEDEDRHGRVFEIIASALDEHDCLVAGESPESLERKIAGIGEFFLPRTRRNPAHDPPLGKGGRVWVLQGNISENKITLIRRLIDDSEIRKRLEERARSLGKRVDELKVVIKPSFIFGYNRRDPSPLTDPVLLKELSRYLREQGCADIAVVEGRNVYDRFFANRGVHNVATYFDLHAPEYRIVDLGTDQVEHAYKRGMAMHSIGRTWRDADFRISFGKMRSHPCNLVYLTLANLEGLGSRYEEFVFAERQAHRETAIMTLLDAFPPHLALLDAFEAAPDGLVGIMGCAHPKSPRRLYASADAFALDIVAARHLGVKDPRQSSILRAAVHWFGEFVEPIEVIGIDEPIADWRGPLHNEVSAFLSLLAYPVYEFGSGRGALFVPEMDPKAFPPLDKESLALSVGRWSMRRLLGLCLPK